MVHLLLLPYQNRKMQEFRSVKNHGILLSILALIFTIVSTYIDLFRWYNGFDFDLPIISTYLRFIRTVIIAILPWTISKSKTEVQDIKLLKIVFLVIVIADAFLILAGKLGIAIFFFALMQILLMYRHTPKRLVLREIKSKLSIPLSFTIIFYVCFFWFSYPLLETHQLKTPIYIYGALLLLSCLSAYLSIFKNFSTTQSTMIFWGMLLFLMCDITVLLPVTLPNNSWALLARAITSIFYTPALLLLAWSGHKNWLDEKHTRL
jgi:hypothetical protein